MSSQTLTFAATAVVSDTRIISGIAVPYNETTTDSRRVQFAPGAFGQVESLALAGLYVQHPMSNGGKAVRIGRVTAWTDSPEALHFEARLDQGELADAMYAALQSGEVTGVSVGVYANDVETTDEITTFTSAEVLELSLIVEGNPAFDNARILVVHSEDVNQNSEAPADEVTISKETQMEDLATKAEVTDLAGAVEDLSREVASFASVNVHTTPAASKFASFGEVVKAVANGDSDAKAELEAFAYEGAVSADTTVSNAWAKPILDYIDVRRPVLNIWNKYPDPKKNTVEYIVEDTDSIDVAEQANEGDDLVYGKFTLETETTRMRTYGGYTEFSLQAIERSDVSVIDQGYKRLAREYAKATESVIRTTLIGANAPTVSGLNLANFGTVIDVTVDAAGKLDDAGHVAEVIIIDRNTFKTLAKLDSDKQFILSRDSGSVNVPGIGATLFGIPVKVVEFGSPVFFFANSEALSVWESGVGKLSDTNILNLTSAVSLFGHLGAAVTDPSALVKVVA